MTTTFKPGHHPDADQLSALIEQALPAHERDGVLAHLAVCSDCRAVVALALPEVPVIQVAPEARRPFLSSRWFSNWMVFLPAATAVAALAAFIIFVHRQAPAPQQQAQIAPAPAQVAASQMQTGSPAQTASSAPKAATAMPAPPPPPSSPQDETANASSASAGAIGSSQPGPIQSARTPAAPHVGVVENQSIQSLPAQNAINSFVSASNNSVAGQNQTSQQPGAPRGALHGGAIGGLTQSNNNLPQVEANAQNGQQQNAQQRGSQTVQVEAEQAPPVTTAPVELNGVISGTVNAQLTVLRQPVPSGLPLLSSAARGPIVLAIDIHHAVFVSNDSGQHWKTVRAVWKGRAVMVKAVAPIKAFAFRESAPSMGALAALPQGAAVAKQGGIALTGTVTDQSGAVIPGATVTVTEQRRLKGTVTTDANGRYDVAGLEPGNYDVEATSRGFMSNRMSNVAVTASKKNVVDFTLRIGAASEAVTVENSQPSIELKSVPERDAVSGAESAPMDMEKQAHSPLFEIVTDKGVHWTSGDGITWQLK